MKASLDYPCLMLDLNPQQIVGWLREQAKKLNDAADSLEQTFKFQSNSKTNSREPALPTLGTVTVAQLEERVSTKSGRTKDLAAHFNVETSAITALLEPTSRVYVAERGWLKVKPV